MHTKALICIHTPAICQVLMNTASKIKVLGLCYWTRPADPTNVNWFCISEYRPIICPPNNINLTSSMLQLIYYSQVNDRTELKILILQFSVVVPNKKLNSNLIFMQVEMY